MGALQPTGTTREEVLRELKNFAAKDVNWQDGKVLSGVYNPGDKAHELAIEAYNKFLAQNALWITMYPSIGLIEKEILDSVVELLRGDDEAVGNITSGGTESILMAVKTARDWARINRPEITRPEMVLPVTAHPAFLKAAHYFDLKVIQTAVELDEFRADLDSYKNALGSNTILAVGSAPNYSHGSIDPISEMASLASEKNILFHVDGCVGGIYLSVLRRMGEEVRDFDFSVPGVTSISADLHKYGYTPKNASVVLYRNRELRKYAWFVSSGTTLYFLINPTTQSSRTGGPIAAAYAVMRYLGEEGFREIVRQSQEATKVILEGIAGIEGLDVLGKPDMCMFTMTSHQVNIFEVDDLMRKRGWQMTPQYSFGGGPANLHVSITQANVPQAELFLKDLNDVVASLVRSGSSVNRDELAEIVKEVSGKPVEEVMMAIIPVIGLTGMELPKEMATLNTILDLLPADVRDELLKVFFNMTS
ncbi:MAG: aminotransferase class V-fold PLP-dependent enzyme [Bacillota bacterium]|nr:aminotransferase class V-fold PLP-dependent enzyme [Bacillota bacterium]